jgi:predicted HicB family RNase H-like nuclease
MSAIAPAYINHELKRVPLRLPDKLHERTQNHARATGVSMDSFTL